MLYLIGLGLNKDGISKEGMLALARAKKVYVEDYTVDFPYSLGELALHLDKKIEAADREFVESLQIVDEAKKKDVALLVYGNPLVATTHIAILNEAKQSRVKVKVIHAASVFDAVGETGLQLYKFGKVASMPAWKKNFTPESFMDIIKDNQNIEAHSLVLVDIGLEFSDALHQLQEVCKKKKIKLGNIVVCQRLGAKHQRIYYNTIEHLLQERVQAPYCIIIPGKLHFVEKEVLRNWE